MSLQVVSEGRAVLGIGRGDSSVQRIGRTQDPVARFEGYLIHVIAGSTGMPREMGMATLASLARDVLPAVRTA